MAFFQKYKMVFKYCLILQGQAGINESGNDRAKNDKWWWNFF
jgi:hypothetical protein